MPPLLATVLHEGAGKYETSHRASSARQLAHILSNLQKRGASARHPAMTAVFVAGATIVAAVGAGIAGRASTVLRASIAPK